MCFYRLCWHNGKVRPGTWEPKMFRWDPGPPKWGPGPGTPKYLSKTQERGPLKLNSGPRTPKYLSGTRDFEFSIFLVVYSTLYISLVTKLCINLFIKINLFHGKYTEVAITICCKFQRIINSYLRFSKILGKKKLWRSFNLSSKVGDKLTTS